MKMTRRHLFGLVGAMAAVAAVPSTMAAAAPNDGQIVSDPLAVSGTVSMHGHTHAIGADGMSTGPSVNPLPLIASTGNVTMPFGSLAYFSSHSAPIPDGWVRYTDFDARLVGTGDIRPHTHSLGVHGADGSMTEWGA